MINEDAYMEKMERIRELDIEKIPTSKVPAVNLQKLAFERKSLEIRVAEDLVVRDQFDWDLNELHLLSPSTFSKVIGEKLSLSPEEKEREIKKMTNSILDQILVHIEKNTFFPRVRFSKKEEEIIAEGQICVNCNSLLQNQDNCAYCGFSFEKKLPMEKRLDDIVVPIRQITRQRTLENSKKKQGARQQILSLSVSTNLTRDSKKCNYCSKVNPFFRIDCVDCGGGLDKKRKQHKATNASYCLLFWDLLLKSPTFGSYTSKVTDWLEEKDFIATYKLYEKIRKLFESPPIWPFIGIQDEFQAEIVLNSVKEAYNELMTPNVVTNKLFDEFSYQKLTGKYRNMEDNVLRLDTVKMPEENLQPGKFYYKPSELDSKYAEVVAGFDLAKKRFVQPDVPGNVPMQVEQQKIEEESSEDYNIDYCGVCGGPGTLICCETCPAAYHIQCLGFERSPRGRWKCYFCKIVKHGILFAHKLPPLQEHLCMIFKENAENWMVRAHQLLDVLKKHPCSLKFSGIKLEHKEEEEEKAKIKHKTLVEIEQGLDKKEYKDKDEFLEDVAELWESNMRSYGESTAIHIQAKVMNEFFKCLIKKEEIFSDKFVGSESESEEEKPKSEHMEDAPLEVQPKVNPSDNE